MERRPKIVVEAVVLGWILAYMLMGFAQDLAGLDAYIAFVREYWVSVPAWIWPLAMLPIIVYLGYLKQMEDDLYKLYDACLEAEDERTGDDGDSSGGP